MNIKIHEAIRTLDRLNIKRSFKQCVLKGAREKQSITSEGY